MQIVLIAVGKTESKDMQSLISIYENRLTHYIKFTSKIIPNLKQTKKLSAAQQKEKEGLLILAQLKPADVVVLLDENGKQMTSPAFAHTLQKYLNSGIKQLIFVIGGAYGFSNAVYQRANAQIGLSKMTFSHQMIRLFFVEQLYRGFSILANEPYHNQ